MIDIEATRKKLAEQTKMVERYDELKACVLVIEHRNDLDLHAVTMQVSAGDVRPPALDRLEDKLSEFIVTEWRNGNLQDQMMAWLADQMETIERNLK